jgi:hypothetical protein
MTTGSISVRTWSSQPSSRSTLVTMAHPMIGSVHGSSPWVLNSTWYVPLWSGMNEIGLPVA